MNTYIENTNIGFDTVNDNVETLMTAGRSIVALEKEIATAKLELAVEMTKRLSYLTGVIGQLEATECEQTEVGFW